MNAPMSGTGTRRARGLPRPCGPGRRPVWLCRRPPWLGDDIVDAFLRVRLAETGPCRNRLRQVSSVSRADFAGAQSRDEDASSLGTNVLRRVDRGWTGVAAGAPGLGRNEHVDEVGGGGRDGRRGLRGALGGSRRDGRPRGHGSANDRRDRRGGEKRCRRGSPWRAPRRETRAQCPGRRPRGYERSPIWCEASRSGIHPIRPRSIG